MKIRCPHCEQRLWRIGSQKYYLFDRNETDNEEDIYWLEEFFCETHETIWMQISQKLDGTLTANLPSSSDWSSTLPILDPDVSNPSVRELHHAMHRTQTNQPQVEIFANDCPFCRETVKLVRDLAGSSCQILVYDLKKAANLTKAEQYGVDKVPSVVVNRRLVLRGKVNREQLQAALLLVERSK